MCAVACGTLCDVEWAVAFHVERCAMWNEVECGLCDTVRYVVVALSEVR